MTRFLFAWMADSPVGDWVNSSHYIWPTLECIHFASLCVLLGSLLVIDLRLIGWYRDRCISMMPLLLRLTVAAFVVNFTSGLLFIAGNTAKYLDNPAFEIKLALILAAGINAVVYRLWLHRLLDTNAVTKLSIAVGYLSLLLWAGVIVCGRMITFYAKQQF